jgi:UDP-glucose 4-epimerase
MTHTKEKIVVTGGAGFIGSHIVDELVTRGYDVHVIDNLVAGKKELVPVEATLHILDIRDKDSISPIFVGATYVFHLAALPSVPYSIEHPEETHMVNTVGTLNVLLAARAAKVKRVIFSSSSAVYGDQDIVPVPEDAICIPNTPYGLQKYESEHYMRLASELYGLETVSLRYFNLYGPRQNAYGPYASVVAKFIDQKSLGQPMTVLGDGSQTRDFVHVADVVTANMRAMESTKVGKGETINIGGGKEYSIINLAHMLGGEITFLPPRVEIMHSVATIERANNLLDWEPKISLEEGIRLLQ